MLRHGGSQSYREEGASQLARRGKNAEAFLEGFIYVAVQLQYSTSFTLSHSLACFQDDKEKNC